MKEIKAIIQPFMLIPVLHALNQLPNLPGVSVSDVRCMDAAHGSSQPDNNIKIELMVPDEMVDRVLDAIQNHAHTGRAGDGSIFVIDIQKTVRIRTGEHNNS